MILYQVTIRWIKTDADPAKVQPAFDALGAWARLNVYSWYIWSNFTAEQISQSVRARLDTEDGIAVFAIDPNVKAGWAPEWFWRWIDTQGASGING